MQLVIFDIDGTLVGCGSERRFWRYLWARKHQGLRRLLAFSLFMLRYLPVGGIHTPKKNKAYLTGLGAAAVDRLAADFVATELARELYEPAVARLAHHVKRGDTVLLLSGTLQPIARALADRLGVAHVCGTLCGESRGVLRARPPERHPFGSAKLLLAQEFAELLHLDLGAAVAYGDSFHDLDLLEAVRYPVVVRPDRKLLAVALARNWEILSGETESASVTAC